MLIGKLSWHLIDCLCTTKIIRRSFIYLETDIAESGCEHCLYNNCCNNCPTKVLKPRKIKGSNHSSQYKKNGQSLYDRLNATETLIMLLLLSCRPSDNGCIKSVRIDNLSATLSRSQKTIKRCLASLQAKGYILLSNKYISLDLYDRFDITICSYDSYCLPQRQGGSGYLLFSRTFVVKIVQFFKGFADINFLRLVLRMLQLYAVCDNSCPTITTSYLYDLLPSYVRRAELDDLISQLKEFGILFDDEQRPGHYVVMVPDDFVADQIKKDLYDLADQKIASHLQITSKSFITNWILEKYPNLQEKIIKHAVSYGSLGCLAICPILVTINDKYNLSENYRRWTKNPQDFIHLFSHILANKFKNLPPPESFFDQICNLILDSNSTITNA